MMDLPGIELGQGSRIFGADVEEEGEEKEHGKIKAMAKKRER